MSNIDYRELFQKFHMGDPLSNKELEYLIAKCELIHEAVSGVGDIYYLVLANNNRMLETLKGYRESRKRHA